MADHPLRARYIDLVLRDEDQDPNAVGLGVVKVRTSDDELIPMDLDVLQATYVPVQTTTADLSELMG